MIERVVADTITLMTDGDQSAQNQRTATVVYHESSHDLGLRNIGTVRTALKRRGFRVVAASFECPAAPTPDARTADVVVVMGSADAAYDDGLPWLAPELGFVREAVAKDVPVLGICFGGQILARALGGQVRRAETAEIGFVTVETDDPHLIAPGPWMQFHYDTFTVPPGGRSIARTAAAEQAFTFGRHLGVQFHPEIDADVFDSWALGWDGRGERSAVEATVDVPALAAEIAAREAHSHASCDRLVELFLRRS